MSSGPRAIDDVVATVAPAAKVVRRRLPEIVLGLAVLVTVLAGLALVGAATDDARISRNAATAEAEVLEGSTFFRTLVRFTVPGGQAIVPERGVFYPRGLVPGQVVPVEYDVTEPELARVAGRGVVDGVGPMLLGVLGAWVVLGPTAVWLRRRRAARGRPD